MDKRSYALGAFLTFELLKHHLDSVSKIYIASHNVTSDTLEKLNALKGNVEIEINDKIIHKLIDKENVYVVGEFVPFITELNHDKLHILINDVSDLGELGTIIRTAVAFNFLDIALINSDIDIFESKTIRATMGAIFLANVKKYKTKEDYLIDNKGTEFLEYKKDSDDQLPLSIKIAIDLYKHTI